MSGTIIIYSADSVRIEHDSGLVETLTPGEWGARLAGFGNPSSAATEWRAAFDAVEWVRRFIAINQRDDHPRCMRVNCSDCVKRDLVEQLRLGLDEAVGS